MTNFLLHISLQSDAAFGRGDGIAGLVDAEVQHDVYGFPYIGGRTLKGLLVEECASLLFALNNMQQPDGWMKPWIDAADSLFGTPGSGTDGFARLRIGPAQLPEDLRSAAKHTYRGQTPDQMRESILPALTAVRRQTAVDPKTGAPKQETLRTSRVLLRGTSLMASVAIDPDVDPDKAEDARLLGLLAATVLALRRGGSERNRGRGELIAKLMDSDDDVTQTYFSDYFVQEVHA